MPVATARYDEYNMDSIDTAVVIFGRRSGVTAARPSECERALPSEMSSSSSLLEIARGEYVTDEKDVWGRR